jgi:hypothetical protein
MLCQVHNDRIFRTFNRQNPFVSSYDYHSVVWGEWIESLHTEGCREAFWCTEESFCMVEEQNSILQSFNYHCSYQSLQYIAQSSLRV